MLEYLENEKNEEFITLSEKQILITTIRALNKLQELITKFSHANFSKADSIRWIDGLPVRVQHPELVEDEIVIFKETVEDWVNQDVPVDYKRLTNMIETRFDTLMELASKKVAVTPEEAVEADRLAKIYLGGTDNE